MTHNDKLVMAVARAIITMTPDRKTLPTMHEYDRMPDSMREIWNEAAQAALTAIEQAGYAVVPREPTERRMADLEMDKDTAYYERNNLVAALARLFPSGTLQTNIPGWSPEWHGCVYIDLPTGQISYHYHDSQAYLFDDLPPYGGAWDGHDKDTVHDRLARMRMRKPC